MAELEEKGIITTPVDEMGMLKKGTNMLMNTISKASLPIAQNDAVLMNQNQIQLTGKDLPPHIKGGVNLSPKGVNIGYPTQQKAVGQAEGEGFDEMTKEFIQMHRIGSKMEDDTENALNMIEKMRKDTVRKAEK
jgi:hypothetical protein